MISGPNLEEQIEAAQTISSKTPKTKHDRQLMLFFPRYCCWALRTVEKVNIGSALPYLSLRF